MTRVHSAKGYQPSNNNYTIFEHGAAPSGIAAPHPTGCSVLNHEREWSENYVAPCCQRRSSSASSASSSSSYATPPPSPPQSQQQHRLQSVDLGCNGYNVLRKDRTRGYGGGIAFIIHNTVQYRALSLDLNSRDQYLEVQGIAVRSGDTELELYNVYIPPVASCPTGYHPDIRTLLDGDTRLVLGDFNAHHQLWHSSLGEDQRGASLAELIDESTFCILNDDAPTRIMGPGLINCTTWRSVISLRSDHLPIIVCLDRPNDLIVSECRTYINQKKADWHGYREFTDRIFNGLPIPSNVHKAERKFRETITAAAARFIPAGRISVVRPHFPAEAAGLADERDDIRSTNPDDPRIAQLNRDISRLVNEDKRNKWLDHLNNCNLSSGVGKLWSTVRSLSNPTKKDDRVAIKFADTTISDPKRCARAFCRQFIEHPERDKAKKYCPQTTRSSSLGHTTTLHAN
ncbi:uncharacterized protein LOC135948669 [Calliphora vicina]|uniref:uncharacterized protein LOC135948669 n=1 Tax=Calliphora vicina TaxID=7373 RepID=UPI00325AB10F